MEEYLKETKYLDFNKVSIKNIVNDLTKNLKEDKEKAIAIHDYVRETILFGFNRKFYDLKASEVLESKIGFCNNKTTLFISMLRCAGIPARCVFVDINKQVLDGIVDPRTDYVDHSYSEVYLNNKWIKVDSYILDDRLFKAAKEKIMKEDDKILGYGIHRDGSNVWSGEDNSFSQFVFQDSKRISTQEYGIFNDVDDFYKKVEKPWNKSNCIQNIVFFLFSKAFNSNVEKIRNELKN
jgi:hypothetical protein